MHSTVQPYTDINESANVVKRITNLASATVKPQTRAASIVYAQAQRGGTLGVVQSEMFQKQWLWV